MSVRCVSRKRLCEHGEAELVGLIADGDARWTASRFEKIPMNRAHGEEPRGGAGCGPEDPFREIVEFRLMSRRGWEEDCIDVVEVSPGGVFPARRREGRMRTES